MLFPACMSINHTCAQCPWSPEEPSLPFLLQPPLPPLCCFVFPKIFSQLLNHYTFKSVSKDQIGQ